MATANNTSAVIFPRPSADWIQDPTQYEVRAGNTRLCRRPLTVDVAIPEENADIRFPAGMLEFEVGRGTADEAFVTSILQAYFDITATTIHLLQADNTEISDSEYVSQGLVAGAWTVVAAA